MNENEKEKIETKFKAVPVNSSTYVDNLSILEPQYLQRPLKNK